MSGGNGAPFMLETAKTLSKAIPVAKLSTLDGQTHDVHPEALAPVLVEFFAEEAGKYRTNVRVAERLR